MAAITQTGSRADKQLMQGGFTFIGLLVIIAISGIVLSAVGIVWQQDVQRTKEQELLYFGDQYRRAITHYYENSPGGAKQFPQKLSQLVLDKRFPTIKRHIRTLYPNPMSADKEWTLIKEQGRIKGVTTASTAAPIKQAGFDDIYKDFDQAKSYADWQFVHINTDNTSNKNIPNITLK
jgi:type II secretory pathway pseudopilin PulG